MAESAQFDASALQKLEGLNKHIEVLFDCKPLPESEISKLCEQVSPSHPSTVHHCQEGTQPETASSKQESLNESSQG